MTNTQIIAETLSLFNNRSFTKKQWEIIFKGCGCPKSAHFWRALKENNLQTYKRMYTLIDLNTESFKKVWDKYCAINRESVKKAYYKNKAKQRAEEMKKNFKGVTLYMVGGYLTEAPERDN